MNTVNMNELLAAHINFNIQSEDIGFGQDGELIGYSEVGAGYRGDDRVEMEFNPLCDTAELSDDATRTSESRIVEVKTGLTLFELHQNAQRAAKRRELKAHAMGLKTWRRRATIDASKLEWRREEELGEGRWAHIADADKAERQARINLFNRLDTKNRPWGEMQEMTKWRKARWARLLKFVEECNNEKTLRRCQQEAWKRYLAAVKRALVTKQWWSGYLTKFEMRELSNLISDKRKMLLNR